MDITTYIEEIKEIISSLDLAYLEKIVGIIRGAAQEGHKIYVFGNGGSATTASHIAGDLNKTAGLKADCLNESSYLMTAWANDCSYPGIFRLQLDRVIEKGDVVIGISGSGLSKNILYALQGAKNVGAITIGLTGFHGGQLVDLADECLIVPCQCMEQIEDIHLMIGHIMTLMLKNG